MKKIVLAVIWMIPTFLFGQSYESLWKQVEDALNKDLPQTEQQVLRQIAAKAEKEKNYGQLLKAELEAGQSCTAVSRDSLNPVIERLQQREERAKDPVLRAVYQTVLGSIYERNYYFGENRREIAKHYYDMALQHPEQLAAVKADSFRPFVKEGEDSRIYSGDLLSVIGYETKHYDVLRDYYLKKGNRVAAMMSSLEWLMLQAPYDDEKSSWPPFFARLDSLAEAYADLPETGEVAIRRYRLMEDNAQVSAKEKWEYIDVALKRWGTWDRMNELRNKQKELKSLNYYTWVHEPVLPHREITVGIGDIRGISKLTMRVYRVNATAMDLKDIDPNKENDYRKIKGKLTEKPELTQVRTYGGKAPYEQFNDTLKLSALPVGVYMVEVETLPSMKKVERSFYYVSNLRVLSQHLSKSKTRYVVVNATTGQPVGGAKLRFNSNGKIVTLTTDSKGEAVSETGSLRVTELFVTTDDDKACAEMNHYGYFTYYKQQEMREEARIFTDRSIYRPGQVVHVSVILYKTEKGFQHSVRKGEKVQVTLENANGKEIGKEYVTTDDYGTCSAQFTLPRKGLTGQYCVRVDRVSNWFRVEEYKRPTFEVEMPKVTIDYKDGDTLQVKGIARTYAGTPVQGAKVKYTVERTRHQLWWRYSYYWNQITIGEDDGTHMMAEGEVVTDANGNFSIPTPMVLPMTKYAMLYNFEIDVDVTDQAGETHYAELSLPLGNRKSMFLIDLPTKILKEDGGSMTFMMQNSAGVDTDASVRYRVDGGKWNTVKTMTKCPLAKGQLKVGKHTVEAICGEDSLKREFVVFSLDDKRPVAETDDWFYASSNYFPNDGTPVTVQVGSSASDVHVVYTILSGDRLIESGSVDLTNELLNRKFTYKEDYDNGILISFAWVKEGKSYVHDISIERPKPDMNLKLQWQTFRNRLGPGQNEEWTLTILGPDGKPVKAQLLATLYDKSLDKLASHEWSMSVNRRLPLPQTSWFFYDCRFETPNASWTESLLKVRQLTFNRFDHSIYPDASSFRRGVYMTRNTRLMGSLASRASEISYGTQTPAPKKFEGMAMATVDESLQGRIAGMDILETKETVADNLVGMNVSDKQNGIEQMQMRENLQETAFFYPQLLADSEGRVSMKFTLPECLTTWHFMGLAHTQDMKTGILTDDAVARKEVMIIPNMPRFVREGDLATISARILNTREKAIIGKARLELLDPETMQVVSAQEQNVQVTANGTSAVTFTYDSRSTSYSLLVAKVMVSGEGFSDGEQHYLPILPNRERVTVTVPFTQTEPGTKTIDLYALKDKTNSQLTLEYTNNPVWLMIQALPTVGHPHDNCAICQASSYYANTIGHFIIQQNPQAKGVFESWSREQGNETSLMSNLQKNQELKDLVLDETPWLADANREQEQKERLADFFDENLMQQRQNSSLDNLRHLQLADGSWSWWPGMDGSIYMTVEISEMLVRLNQMTTTQDATKQMLTRAFDYMGKEMVKMVDEMKKDAKKGWKPTFPSHMVLQWLYICALDGRQLPANVKEANNYLIRLLKKETTNQSIYDKAMSAVILNNKTYVRSLKEYTVYREDMGRYYDTNRALYSWHDYRIPTQVAAIEAIKRLTPEDTKTIEEMQRWLLQEKRTQAWDTPVNSADAIYAFLNGNSESLKAQPKTMLKVDGEELHTSQATAGIGYVKTTMSGDNKQTFTAEKTSTGTSWGAVYMQFMQPTAEVETQNSGLKVKREILGAAANSSLFTIHSSFSVGDRIKVRITIEADRDYDFVQIVDKRAACMEPVNQLSGYHWGYYIAPKDCATNYYFDRLAKGKHVIETEYYIDRPGTYETGTCTASCAYSPEFRGVAKSQTIKVE